MNRCNARLFAAALAIAAGCLVDGMSKPAHAQPALTHVAPGAVSPGRTTEVVLNGTKLNGPLRVWTSFPAAVDIVPADPKQKDPAQIKAKFTLGPNVPCGIGGIAVANSAGASDVVYLLIDDLASVADGGQNHEAAKAQKVEVPAAIDGVSDGTLADYYRFTALAGESISCEVIAARLGSDYDALVRVLDPAGNELFLADDDASTGADARFVFTAAKAGDYVLEIRDNRYKPGGRYRLRLGRFPLVSAPLPLFVSRGRPTAIGFLGPQVAELSSLDVLTLGTSGSGPFGLTLRTAGSNAAAWTSVGVTDASVISESAGADQSKGTAIELPCVASGVLTKAGERDRFSFSTKKGTAIRCEATSRSCGSPAIVRLAVLDTAGKRLAESPVTDSDEPVLTFTPPADGAYQLQVEELAGRGSADYAYAIQCDAGPQFSLALKNDKNNHLRYALADGGAMYLDVQCSRFAYDGPIALGIESSRPGWQAINARIPAKGNETRLYLVPPVDFEPGEIAALRIVGRAVAAGEELAATMTTTAQLRVARPQTPYPPAWHDGVVFVSAVAPRPLFYTEFARHREIHFPRQVGKAQLTIDFERLDAKFKDVPLTVLPLGVPTGISATVKRNGNGPKETYDLLLTGPKDLPEGTHLLRYFAFAELAGQGQGGIAGDVRLNIITPLAVAVTPAGPLVAGQKQKVKLTLTRRGDDKQPVELKLPKLPAGVAGPEKISITVNQNETEIELTAAADVKPVKFEQFVATATSTYAGVAISAESPPAILEVKAP